MTTLAILLFVIFLLLSLLHFSWGFGGSWGFEDAIPKNEEGKKMLNPKKKDSIVVGLGLLIFGVFYLIKVDVIEFRLPQVIITIAGWIIPSIFLLRAIGDFRYIGFTKKIRSTTFAKKDSRLYSPLCLGISIIGFILGMV